MRQKIFCMALHAIFLCINYTDTHGTAPTNKKYALITYPVIDLYGSADINELPIPAATRNYAPCSRIHQALYNECFEVVATSAKMVALSIPWAIYAYDALGKPQNCYWAESKNLIMLDTLPNNHELLQTIPQYAHTKKRITIKRPFTDSAGITYSVGTQFVCTDDQPEPAAFRVVYLNGHKKTLHYLDVPRSHACENKKKSPAHARQDFVQFITELIDEIGQEKIYNTIPYVWGGASFTQPYSENFTEDATGFHRVQQETVPLSGYDCSLLVLRFAQMAQVPYYFKTTSMLEKYGKPFTPADTLEEGDLIWLQGHLVIVTDIKNNRVTEAGGYGNFVGKVHTIHLAELLRDIGTWEDLVKAYYKNKHVMRLDTFGNDFKTSPVKLFKLF